MVTGIEKATGIGSRRAHRIYIVFALDGFESEAVGEALGAGELADGDYAAALEGMVRRELSKIKESENIPKGLDIATASLSASFA